MVRLAAALTVLLCLALAPAASAHALLEGSSPERGAALRSAPDRVELRFSEPVEAAFGAVRVFDAHARRVDRGPILRSHGGRTVGVALRRDLPAGTYVATYRIISADSHPVSGGLTFTVGRGSSTAAPAVADLVGGGTGPVTETAFGVARGVTYLATALLVGGLIFALLTGDLGPAAARRARRLAVGAAGAGILAGLGGLVLQGATAGGTSFWAAVDPDVVGEVLDTRFGHVWALRIVAFAAAVLPLGPLRAPAAAVLLVAPALGGHAATSDPQALLVPLDVVHVAAMSVWLGGLGALLVVVPAATRAEADPAARTRLLARVLLRFSPVALGCVLVLLATGAGQSIVHLEELGDLTGTAFGRAILVKVALLAALVGLGAVQRRRVIPRLRAIASGPPGAAGRLLRSVLRAEVALTVVVLGVTSALVSYAPPAAVAQGPWSTTARIGAHTLEATLDPARVGPNELHVYLLDRRTGAPFDGTQELTVEAALPEHRIGPLPARATKAGPGHYIVRRLDLVPRGEWHLTVAARLSEFEEERAELEVPVR